VEKTNSFFKKFGFWFFGFFMVYGFLGLSLESQK